MALIRELIKKGNNSNRIERIYYTCDNKHAAKYWKTIADQYIHDVKIEPTIKKAWNNIILWTFGNPNCEIDITKGLGLIGRTGSGKTMTFYILNDFIEIDKIRYKKGEDLVNLKYRIQSALVIASEYAREGDIVIHKYSNFANLCIDDLGAENSLKSYFGNKVNVIQEILENRYNNNLMTHFSSNLKMEDISDRYGDRVFSRLHDTCNIIEINDCDFRVINSK
ncbi:DnaC-like helicase loader [Rhodobacteraceae phage LS06-2018-MD05]|nr:DnaC-like helicase loader [Rhodobacteraceae phage LS06-2018-MD05]